MTEMRLTHPHGLDLRTALERAHALADELATRLEARYRWHDNTLHFERAGADGTVRVGPDQIEVEVHLSWLLGAFRVSIEEEIRRLLARHFD